MRTHVSCKLNYFNGKCYKLSNPVLGAEGDKQSVVPAIASKLRSSSKYIFLTTGWGGTSITRWGKNNSELSEYTNKITVWDLALGLFNLLYLRKL